MIRCPHCRRVLARMRAGKLKFDGLRILALARAADGTQTCETVCPSCARDVALPLEVPAAWMRSNGDPFKAAATTPQDAPRLMLRVDG